MPKLELPKIDIKSFDLPKVDLKSFDLPKVDLKSLDVPPVVEKPLYAGVGAADLAYETAKGYVTEVQGQAKTRYAAAEKAVKGFEVPQPKSLQSKAQARLAELQADAKSRFAELQADAKALPAKVQSTVKTAVDENRAQVTSTYADLAKRGEAVVVKFRSGDAPAVKKAAPATAKKAAPAKKAPAKKAAAKKAPAKKAPAKKA
ncbi:MAG TPA: hypothetical protein VJ872_09760 [Nocardioides sp.]|nr:hypothetical protein [Nocardioides sp.]